MTHNNINPFDDDSPHFDHFHLKKLVIHDDNKNSSNPIPLHRAHFFITRNLQSIPVPVALDLAVLSDLESYSYSTFRPLELLFSFPPNLQNLKYLKIPIPIAILCHKFKGLSLPSCRDLILDMSALTHHNLPNSRAIYPVPDFFHLSFPNLCHFSSLKQSFIGISSLNKIPSLTTLTLENTSLIEVNPNSPTIPILENIKHLFVNGIPNHIPSLEVSFPNIENCYFTLNDDHLFDVLHANQKDVNINLSVILSTVFSFSKFFLSDGILRMDGTRLNISSTSTKSLSFIRGPQVNTIFSSYSLIKSIPLHLGSLQFPRLKFLGIKDSPHLTKLMPFHAPHLADIDIAASSIEFIAPNFAQYLPRLSSLTLGFISKPITLPNLESASCKSLTLANCKIQNIDSKFGTKLPNLVKLHFSSVTFLSPISPIHSDSLETINLSHSSIPGISADFLTYLPKCHNFDLSSTTTITEIPNLSSPLLTSIDLRNSSIVSFHPEFGDPRILPCFQTATLADTPFAKSIMGDSIESDSGLHHHHPDNPLEEIDGDDEDETVFIPVNEYSVFDTLLQKLIPNLL